MRIATLHSGLKRAGPGLLLRDILRGEDTQVQMVMDMIVAVRPDVILMQRFDFDLGNVALGHFAERLSGSGMTYPFHFALAPNSGIATGLDLNGDGRLGGAADAIGYGDFSGHGGMALFSRFPIVTEKVRDLSQVTWAGSKTNEVPLSSVGHWDIPIEVPGWDRQLHLFAYHAGTPAFDGPERRNFRRNAAENLLWLKYLDGDYGRDVPNEAFVIIGDSNLDPNDGAGDHSVMQQVLADPRLQDARPQSRGAVEAALAQADPNSNHQGDPALDTADFRDDGGPGNLRVDYILPSVDFTILDAGVFWPASSEPQANILAQRKADISWHGLVWVDIIR